MQSNLGFVYTPSRLCTHLHEAEHVASLLEHLIFIFMSPKLQFSKAMIAKEIWENLLRALSKDMTYEYHYVCQLVALLGFVHYDIQQVNVRANKSVVT